MFYKGKPNLQTYVTITSSIIKLAALKQRQGYTTGHEHKTQKTKIESSSSSDWQRGAIDNPKNSSILYDYYAHTTVQPEEWQRKDEP